MRKTLTTNDEVPGGDDVEYPRKARFTLTDLLTFVTAFPVCVGVVAAVEFHASMQSYEWFGIDWYSDVRHFLIYEVGVPSKFVTGYVTFAMINLPTWVCFAVISLILGLIRSKRALTMGVAFILSIFVWDLMSDYFSGLHAQTNLRLVSIFGFLVTASCFAFGRIIRGHLHVPDRRMGRIGLGFTCLAIVATVAVSIYGWWIVDQTRQAGLRVQEMFRDAVRQ